MSLLGIASSSLFSLLTQNVQSNKPRFQGEFQRLGQDLQSGNLSAAQSDLTALTQNIPTSSSSSTLNGTPVSLAFQKLSQDLQSGNVTAAQQDYSTIQQDFRSVAGQSQSAHGHHHHVHGTASSDASANAFNQLFSELGSALQSGNLSSAQQAYNSLQQDFMLFSQGGSTAIGPSASSGVSVSA